MSARSIVVDVVVLAVVAVVTGRGSVRDKPSSDGTNNFELTLFNTGLQ